jgi:3-dehydroquinate synthase
MRTVHVNLGDRSYDIHIGHDLPVGASLAGEEGLRALVVSDGNVGPLHGERCETLLQAQGLTTSRLDVPAGEASKDMAFMQRIYDAALEAGLDRLSVIVALGGGMVGDLAGFAAATFLRGVRLIQVPTTLLSMVDSSVGGKTAVNLPQGKNLVGAFYQPVEVAADLATLSTLPEREYVSGLAEVVKYGVIWDAELFRRMEESVDGLLSRDATVLEDVVARCCEIKAEVVAMDEREAGVRAVLNYGHTLGHALEKELAYSGCLHGEAVSVGMVYAGELSVKEKGFPEDERDRVAGLLKRLGLPVGVRDLGTTPAWEKLRGAMAADKKTRGRIPRFVLAERLGSVAFGCAVDDDLLKEAFAVIGAGAS